MTISEDILIVKINEVFCTEVTEITERVMSDAGNSPPSHSTSPTVLQAPGEDQNSFPCMGNCSLAADPPTLLESIGFDCQPLL